MLSARLTLPAEPEPRQSHDSWMQQHPLKATDDRIVRVYESVAQRCDEQHQGCNPLLPVDQHPFGDIAAGRRSVEKRAKKVRLSWMP